MFFCTDKYPDRSWHREERISSFLHYLMVALFCSLENKMGIPNTLLMLLTIASRLCRICHALQHFLWPFLSRSICPQNVSFANSILNTPTTQDMQNQERSSMIYAQNDQQTHPTSSSSSSSFMPLTHFQPTSYYPQLHNQSLELPYLLLPEHQAQLVFPASSYQSEGSKMRSKTHNLSPDCLASGVLSDALPRDMPEGACSILQLGTSDIEEQRKFYLSTWKAARAKRMKKLQIRAGFRIKSSGGYSS